MIDGRTSTAVVVVAISLALAALLLGPDAPAQSSTSAGQPPPLVGLDLLALADALDDRSAPPPRGHLRRPPGYGQPRYEREPRACLVGIPRCPSEPCVQFVVRQPPGSRGRPLPERSGCDRFPDADEGRLIPLG